MNFVEPFNVSVQSPVGRRWRLSDSARDYVVATQGLRPETEATFAGGVELEERLVTTATLCAWGTRTEGFVLAADFPAGSLMLHTHPGVKYQEAEQSAADLRVAMELAARGIGFAVVNGDGLGLLVVREPRPLKEPSGPTPRVWTFGRWTLIHSRSR